MFRNLFFLQYILILLSEILSTLINFNFNGSQSLSNQGILELQDFPIKTKPSYHVIYPPTHSTKHHIWHRLIHHQFHHEVYYLGT